MRKRVWRLLLLLTLGIGSAFLGGIHAGATSTAEAALHFPAGAPAWLVTAVEAEAQRFGDSCATLAYLRLGRIPVVILRGNFRCVMCDIPPGGKAPTGHYASMRFDAVTHQIHDDGLGAGTEAEALAGLCAGGCDDRSRIAHDSAQQALDAAGMVVTVEIHTTPKHPCLISTRSTRSGFVAATCSTDIALGKNRTTVT